MLSHHRHHAPVVGHKYSIAIEKEGELVGVIICGRPVSRHLDDGLTIEANRCCTLGGKNGCSMLYGAAWRAAKALGYRRIFTYTLPEEGGASLRGAGWDCEGEHGGGSWDCPSRPREQQVDLIGKKIRWSKAL